MKKNKLYLRVRKVVVLSAIFFLMGLYACKKDGKLVPDFDDGGLIINSVDTFTLRTSLALNDSLRTDFSIYNPLGLYHDPIFGPVSSSIFTQVLLTGVNVDLKSTSSTMDSIVLTLDYLELYGDTATPMTINVYELNNDLSSSSEYYSKTYTPNKGVLLGSKTFVPNLTDSVSLVFNSSKQKAHLRIKLSNTFGQSIMDADADGSNYQMNDNTTFTNFMKGLYITTADSAGNTTLNSGEGSIGIMDMNSSLSTLTMYYNDTSKYDFTINSSAVKYSRFQHNYTGTDIEAHLNSLPTKDTTVSYISALAGVKTKVEFPFIQDLIKDGSVLINKAELIVTVENGTEGNFDEPLESISLAGIDANGDSYFLPDFFEGQDYFGGTYDEASKTYTFNIARHISDLIYGNSENHGIYILANGATTTANRSVIGSEHSTTAKLKFKITYSKL